MDADIEQSWNNQLREYFETDSWRELTKFVQEEYQSQTVYPEKENIFNAFNSTSFKNVRVVILGQDPYHSPGQAHGLSFSVESETSLPPSLRNIIKELQNDIGDHSVLSGNLKPWAQQGVLLLNSVLTVRDRSPASHAKHGWEEFTDCAIKKLSDEQEHIVFILWGAYAQKKSELIDQSKHHIITSAHPSPFSARKGFFGSRPFSQTNKYLLLKNKKQIIW